MGIRLKRRITGHLLRGDDLWQLIEYLIRESANCYSCEGVTRLDSKRGISLDQLAHDFWHRNTTNTSALIQPIITIRGFTSATSAVITINYFCDCILIRWEKLNDPKTFTKVKDHYYLFLSGDWCHNDPKVLRNACERK
ncbi:hypothetical protein TcasGA2_TC001203 [Tribolium castaneum]|uniref:Uncharacterized protein n=1 Tax=Tribolium castaneum TaxID=7070 RepID=D6WAR2_TRICA|nr:hypothetical protein TcasGA2_TC001203 [Tribolium castaneum]